MTADALCHLTEFDRVLIYRFDQDWNGTVVGEASNGRLPSLLHHRFPASDIPAQARELYRINRVRLIPDSAYCPVPISPAIHPRTGQPLDMTFSALRSVSPIHVEYMRNMETASSMSISIIREGKLWGLVSCHHKEPKAVSYSVRLTCDLFARAFSLRLAALEQSDDLQGRIQVRATLIRLLAAMADQANFATALQDHGEETLRFVNANGAAVLTENRCVLVGETPDESQVRAIAEWLFAGDRKDVFHTDSLSSIFAPAAAYKEKASGLLAVAISKIHPSYVLWFRPEVVQTINWAGDPRKPVDPAADGVRLHPRRSFATWLETVRDKSLPWRTSEVEGAGELRNAVVGIVLRRVEELAQLNAELTRSNKELEAFSYSVSHDLRAPLRHIVGYAEILKEPTAADLKPRGERCVRTIIESAEYAGMLVDKLLAFSRMGRSQLQMSKVDMNLLLRETQREASTEAKGRKIAWSIAPLPVVQADLMMLRDAIRNLLENAVKYTRNKEEAAIEVGTREEDGQHVFWVRDNGVGFDQQYAGKLFGVFQRLHRMEDYEGTGIGLANVRRVMERHGGQTWAEGEEGKGATFYFSLPKLVT
ncbi:MAG: ATP-binding protein [Gemmataceae bacterium]